MPGNGRVWASLPMPALVLDERDRITAINPAAEAFLNTTVRALAGEPVYERLAIDAGIEEALARVRDNRSALFINDVAVGTGERAPVTCNIQLAPMADEEPGRGRILFVFTPREIAGRLGRSKHTDSAAKSAIGMAEMLAHEITADLRAIRGDALARARESGRPVRVRLHSKGIDYGRLTARPDGTVDTAEIEGVDPDLRVKPFFAEGSTFSISQFAGGAFNDEMGLEARPIEEELLKEIRDEHSEGSEAVPGSEAPLRPVPAPPHAVSADELLESGVAGTWSSREDLPDSSELARRVRERARSRR